MHLSTYSLFPWPQKKTLNWPSSVFGYLDSWMLASEIIDPYWFIFLLSCLTIFVSKKHSLHESISYLLGSEAWGNKTKEMYYSLLVLNISFFFFYSSKPQSQVGNLIYGNWSALRWESHQKKENKLWNILSIIGILSPLKQSPVIAHLEYYCTSYLYR